MLFWLVCSGNFKLHSLLSGREDGKKRGVGAHGVRGRRDMVFLCTAASRDCLAGCRAPDIGTG